MVELPLTFGGPLVIAPHAIVAIHQSPHGDPERPYCMVHIAGHSFPVLGTVAEVRAIITPKPSAPEPEDHFGDFLASCTRTDTVQSVTVKALTLAADDWCRDNSYDYWSNTEIVRLMAARGHKASGVPIRRYSCLALTVSAGKRADAH